MQVKGIAFLAREAMMVRTFGEQSWRSFLDDYGRQHPLFAQKILPVTRIPAEPFLALNDALTQTFFDGDAQAYWRYGEQSGIYALTQGQLKGLFKQGDVLKFLQFTPMIWKGYFDAGELSVKQTSPTTLEARIAEVPFTHVYFEYSVFGFAEGALRTLGAAHPKPEVVRSVSRGDPDSLYRFRLD